MPTDDLLSTSRNSFKRWRNSVQRSRPIQWIFTRLLKRNQPLEPPEIQKVNGILVRNAMIGFENGLTLPYTLFIVLSLLDSAEVVRAGGFGYLLGGAVWRVLVARHVAREDMEYHEDHEWWLTREGVENEIQQEEQIFEFFEKYGIGRVAARGVVGVFKGEDLARIRFILDVVVRPAEPRPKRAIITREVSYLVAGMLHIIPFVLARHATMGFLYSIPVAIVTHLIFGSVRARATGGGIWKCIEASLTTLRIGFITAYVSYVLAWAMFEILNRE